MGRAAKRITGSILGSAIAGAGALGPAGVASAHAIECGITQPDAPVYIEYGGDQWIQGHGWQACQPLPPPEIWDSSIWVMSRPNSSFPWEDLFPNGFDSSEGYMGWKYMVATPACLSGTRGYKVHQYAYAFHGFPGSKDGTGPSMSASCS